MVRMERTMTSATGEGEAPRVRLLSEARPPISTLTYATGPPRRLRTWFFRSHTEVILCVVLAILLAIEGVWLLQPRFISGRRGAVVDITGNTIKQGGTLATQLELYRQHVGMYPTSLDDLVKCPAHLNSRSWGGPYVTDPHSLKDAWGHRLLYKVPGLTNVKGYDLWSPGPDGDDGTDDDIGNW